LRTGEASVRLDHRVVFNVVAAVALGLLTACGGNAAAPTPTAAPAASSGAVPAPSPQRPTLASPQASPSAAASIAAPTAAATTGSGALGPDCPNPYEIQAGDTLGTISQKCYGDPTQWRPIYDANKDAIGADPDRLKLGTKLTIPPKQS
jgi:nucleoid-associated protein YgaU